MTLSVETGFGRVQGGDAQDKEDDHDPQKNQKNIQKFMNILVREKHHFWCFFWRFAG